MAKYDVSNYWYDVVSEEEDGEMPSEKDSVEMRGYAALHIRWDGDPFSQKEKEEILAELVIAISELHERGLYSYKVKDVVVRGAETITVFASTKDIYEMDFAGATARVATIIFTEFP